MVDSMRICVVGLGSMGPGICYRLARGGHHVRAFDISPAACARAETLEPMISKALDGLEIADEDGTVTFFDNLDDAVQNANLVIENVPENIETKTKLYAQIEPLISDETILATDTSGIPISLLQSDLMKPGKFVGMHWSNPPHIVPMIEVIAGAKTEPQTVATIKQLIKDLNLLPVILKKDVPGFVENRVLYALLRECVDLVEQDVVSPEDLDLCVNWGIGYKLAAIGPMRLLDMAGLDIYEAVSSFLNQELCSRKDVSPMVSDATEKGNLGMKTGKGLFDYSKEELASLPQQRGQLLVALRKTLEGR